MPDQPRRDDDLATAFSDPRLEPDRLRLFESTAGHPVLVVGCVHDHPASVYRVRTLVESLEPDAVAVELPRLAIPLFERVGRRAETDGGDGGEMSAALAAGASVDARCVGVDTLGPRFLATLASELRRRETALATVHRVLDAVTNVAGHAFACRISAALGRYGSPTPVRERAFDHDVAPTAAPAAQAADEQRQLTRSLSVLRAMERPVADEVVDAARERTMVHNLASLATDGSVVAVVGFDHLSTVADLLAERTATHHEPAVTAIRRLWA